MLGFGDVRCKVWCWRCRVWGPGFRGLVFQALGSSSTEAFLEFRGTSLIRNSRPLGPYNRTTSRALRWSQGGGVVSYERGVPETHLGIRGFEDAFRVVQLRLLGLANLVFRVLGSGFRAKG